MIEICPNGIRTVLCIGAHADDIEIGCGGTVLKLLEKFANLSVHWVVLSATAQRESEALDAAERFLAGAEDKSVEIRDFPDSFFPCRGEEIKRFFNDLGRRIAPDIVLTHRLEDRHQDHRLVAELTWNTFRDHMIMEYEIPKYEADLGSPNVYVPLEETTCQRKIDSIIESFETQKAKSWFSAETFWSLLRVRGLEAKSPSRLAEGLYCRKMIL